MLLQFLETGKMLYIMLTVSALGVFSKFLVNRRYKRLIRQTENMGTAKDRYLKQWKVKFENTYRSNSGVNNIPVYVERNMEQYKYMGIRLSWLARLNRLAASFLCLGGIATSFMTYWYDGFTKISALYLVSGVFLCGAMLLWENMCDTAGKTTKLFLHIRDYFENTLVKRLESGQSVDLMPVFEMAGGAADSGTVGENLSDGKEAEILRKKEEAAGREQDADFLRKRLERIASGCYSGKETRKLTSEEEHLIEDIIQEYLYE